jgi:hypothetical protein
VKPSGSTIAPEYLKTEIVNYLQDYIALPNRVKVSDPDYFYIKIMTNVQYNVKLGNKTLPEVSGLVLNGVSNFSANHLEKFGNDFRYSRLVTHIDNTDINVTSNDTKVYLVKRLSPVLNYATSFDIQFNNRAEQEGVYNGVAYPDERVLSSSSFTYVDSNDILWPLSFLEDDALGNVICIYLCEWQ